mgnify:CR=1 FL=1
MQVKRSKRIFFFIPLYLALFIQSFTAVAEEPNNARLSKDMFLGNPNAPVSIIEYASLGCSHCADFHTNTYPKIKENFIDTGKVKFVFRNFPLGTPSLAAAMIAHCAGPEKFFGMVEIFFRSQKQWGNANRPLDELKKTARFGGISNSKVDACLSNQEILTHVQNVARLGQEKYEIGRAHV